MKTLILKRNIVINLTLGCILTLAFTLETLAQSPMLFRNDGKTFALKELDFMSHGVEYIKENDPVEAKNSCLNFDILLLIYPLGTYHYYSKPQDKLVNVEYSNSRNNKIDKIITRDERVIPANILGTNGGSYQYTDLNTGEDAVMKQDQVLAILFKDGNYKFFSDKVTVASALQKIADQINTFNNAMVGTQGGNQIPTMPEDNLEEELPDFNRQLFRDKALSKTKELGDYLSLISNKNTKFQKANEAIDAAVKLFLNEDAIMEVSSVNRSEVQKYKIRKYFERLKLLKYSEIKITWSNISYVSNIKKHEDGNYYGIVTLEQKFDGYNSDGQLVYSDVTKKNMTVILKTYDKYVVGKKETHWDVYLGDIGVVVTK
ncbi:hypothetical protein [Flexithrix dorotheae]|uniref:hypothetical protein n=1 Tax=Flexithrix dorotheae TaxID=70993 RepID=UPI0003728AF1|nr:hypothetical protein [Flexithrix dorotheae]